MGIFAGAPEPGSPQDPWIVIPKPTRELPSPLSQLEDQGLHGDPEAGGLGSGTLTAGRNTLKINPQLSRVVDVIIDVQSPIVAAPPSYYRATLTHQGSEPRGPSDSLISFGKKVLALRSVSSSFGPLSRGDPKTFHPETHASPSSGSNSIPATAGPSPNTSAHRPVCACQSVRRAEHKWNRTTTTWIVRQFREVLVGEIIDFSLLFPNTPFHF